MNIDNEKKRFLQEKHIKQLLNEPKPTEMLIVYLSTYNKNIHNYGIHPALIPLNQKDQVLNNNIWDLFHESGLPEATIRYKGNKKEVTYCRFGSDDGIEPLVIYRNFHGILDSYTEISEEFRLFHNLYHDYKNNRYIRIDHDGNEITVIENSDNCIKIRVKELKQFLAIKEMCLSIQFDYKEFSTYLLDDFGLEEGDKTFKNDVSIRSLGYSNFHGLSSEYQSFSRLLGKKLILPFPKSKSGIFGFSEDEKKKYVDFIIDVDEVGDEILFNSNPELLANYSGSNSEAPNYLTPVHFDKKVLDKYYNQPSKYSVEPSILRCSSLWSLQIDNHNENKICVWLGDLGRDLSYKEQLHWRSYNILPQGSISKTYFKNQILAQHTKLEHPEYIFKSKYQDLCNLCNSKLSSELLLPLDEADTHYFDSLRIPSSNEQSDFDELILGLTKILIDSLNEKFLNKYIDESMRNNLKGGISKLEFVLMQQKINDRDKHIQFLRKLQNLRSSSVAHRKGKNYKKIAKDFEIGDKDLVMIFKKILLQAIKLLDYFSEIVNTGKLLKQ